jgi:hypothetical protein
VSRFVYLSPECIQFRSGIELDQQNLARFAGRQQTTDLVCFELARAEGAVFAFERLIAGSADTDVALLKFQATDHAIETVPRSGLAQTPARAECST